MSYLEAILLGLVQGLTEFLPVSSSGHLVLFETLMGLNEENLAFNVALHLGTLVSILCFYYRDLLKVIEWPFIQRVLITSFPTALIGLGMKRVFDFDHTHLGLVALFFTMTGVILYFSDKKLSGNDGVTVDKKDIYINPHTDNYRYYPLFIPDRNTMSFKVFTMDRNFSRKLKKKLQLKLKAGFKYLNYYRTIHRTLLIWNRNNNRKKFTDE